MEEEQREKDSKKKHKEALLDELVGGGHKIVGGWHWVVGGGHWIVQLMPFVNKLILLHVFKMLNMYVYDVLKVC